MSSKLVLSVNQYLAKNKILVIPNYQRGYVWGKSHPNKKPDSVTYFIDNLLDGFKNKNNIFIQGITVSETEKEINIIDGQQRTTFIYLLTTYLGLQTKFDINYSVRKHSDTFLKALKGKTTASLVEICEEKNDEEFQDIYYLKKSIRIINAKLSILGKEELQHFLNYTLNNINFLYIDIMDANATDIFTMMNGNKAEMLPEEIIKAELLRLVSLERKDTVASPRREWEANMIRSKYAREWDKWLNWWNRTEIREFYHTSNIMELLIVTLIQKECTTTKDFSFESFKSNILRGKDEIKATKDAFFKLRRLQKRFEDTFYITESHNKVGAILTLLSNNSERKSFIISYFAKKEIEDIDSYLKLVYLGLTHAKALAKDKEAINEAYHYTYLALKSNDLYNENDYKEVAFRQLFRRNIEEDTKLNRKFDFAIWGQRSLEHIHPKSKIYSKGSGKLGPDTIAIEDFNGNGSVHCIGNLVLLYKNDNSKFSNSNFNKKKSFYFEMNNNDPFMSRSLLHTISIFSGEKWGVNEIQQNKQNFINNFNNYYSDEIKKYVSDRAKLHD